MGAGNKENYKQYLLLAWVILRSIAEQVISVPFSLVGIKKKQETILIPCMVYYCAFV